MKSIIFILLAFILTSCGDTPKYELNGYEVTGYCIVEFSVSKEGKTFNIVPVDCPEEKYIEYSICAASKFKYKPKVENGVPVDVHGIRNRFSFSHVVPKSNCDS